MSKRKVKKVSRKRKLTKSETAKYNRIRASIDAEMPQIKSRIITDKSKPMEHQ